MAPEMQQGVHAHWRSQLDNLCGLSLEATQVQAKLSMMRGLLQNFIKCASGQPTCDMWTLNTHSCKHTTQRNDLAQALDFTLCLNCGVVTECAGSATRTGTDQPRLLGQTGAGTYYGKPFSSHQVRLEVDPLAGWHCTALSKQGPTVEPPVSRPTDVPKGRSRAYSGAPSTGHRGAGP